MQKSKCPRLVLICGVLLSLLVTAEPMPAQTPRLPMEYLNIEDGLPNDFCASMIQGRLGYIWIGTANGLVRYDGYEYVHYRYTPDDTSSLQGKLISFLLEEESGNLWLGSDWGLHYFDRGRETFTNIPVEKPRPDPDNRIPWYVHYLFADSRGRIWTVSGTENQLHLWDPATEQLTSMPGIAVGSAHPVLKRAPLLEDRNGRIWLGTLGKGLLQFDEESRQFMQVAETPPESGRDTIYALHLDSKEMLWAGTGKGVSIFDTQKQSWSSDPEVTDIGPVYDIREGTEDHLWLQQAYAIRDLNTVDGQIRTYFRQPETDNYLAGPGYPSFRMGLFLWLGKDKSGRHYWVHPQNHHQVFRYELELDRITAYQHTFPEKSWDWGYNAIHIVTSGIVDHSGLLWLACTSGLLKGRIRQGYFRTFLSEKAAISKFTEDPEGRIWMVGENSLFIFSPEDNEWIDLSKRMDIQGLIPIIGDIEYYHPSGCWLLGTGGLTQIGPIKQSSAFSNLARNKPVKVSSREHNNIFLPEFAVDGDPNTRWTSGRSEPQWLEVDLKRSETISQIILHWEACHATQYEIRFSEDGLSWRSVYHTQDGKGKKENLNIQGKARFLKFLFQKKSGPYCFSLWEIEVFGPSPRIKNQSDITGNNLLEDSYGKLWVTSITGLMNLDEKRVSVRTIRAGFKLSNNPFFPYGLGYGYGDRRGLIWAVDGNGNYQQFDSRREIFTPFDITPLNPEKRQGLRLMGEDGSGNYWFKSPHGLYRYQMETHTFTGYLSGYEITAFLEDRRGQIWAGTKTDGFFLVNTQTGESLNYGVPEGLANPWVTTIMEDQSGRLWVGTAGGVSCFNPEGESFENYYQKDGLIRNFIGAESFQDSEGRIYFGGDGFTYFDPTRTQPDTTLPKMVIASLKIGQKEVRPGQKEVSLSRHISLTEAIRLAHHQNAISLEFKALHYQNPESNRYRVLMEGLDTAWVDIGTQPVMNYAGLAPGDYTFKVMGSNGNDQWSVSPASLQIRILPPWYWAWWSKMLYILAALGLFYSYYHFQLHRQLADAEARRLKELDSVKTRLYTNITHEFRTPLTVISGMADQVLDNPRQWLREGLGMIKRNSRQLLNLVNQMLELSKLESNTLGVDFIQGDIVAYLRYLTESFHSYAATKDIQLDFRADPDSFFMDYDPEKMQTVIYNLVGNAIKFTPAGGRVLITVDGTRDTVDGENLRISIEDDGVGIPEAQLPFIFDRFYQVDDSTTRKEEGTGIGLALTKELVKLLRGRIEVESREGKGTTFTVWLPVNREAPRTEHIPKLEEALQPADGTPAQEQDGLSTGFGATADRPLALLVEDNKDVANYLKACLQDSYRTVIAENGRIGIEKALQISPDIIISDVMMPEKDGFEVCATLKKDARTSHIPIILLTAKADQDSRIAGLEYGADAYLVKPFDKAELGVRLQKLIELRQRLREKYSQADLEAVDVQREADPELLFLKTLETVILDHLADEDFRVEPDLCRAMRMSRPQLYKKLKALKGQSPSQLMRNIRLERARKLLKNTHLPIGEIADQVGFREHSYFTKVYLDTFLETPSETRNNSVLN